MKERHRVLHSGDASGWHRWRPRKAPSVYLTTGICPTLVIHLPTKQDEENLRALRKRLPYCLLEKVFQEEDDAYKAASADIGVDTADRITVGLRSSTLETAAMSGSTAHGTSPIIQAGSVVTRDIPACAQSQEEVQQRYSSGETKSTTISSKRSESVIDYCACMRTG